MKWWLQQICRGSCFNWESIDYIICSCYQIYRVRSWHSNRAFKDRHEALSTLDASFFWHQSCRAPTEHFQSLVKMRIFMYVCRARIRDVNRFVVVSFHLCLTRLILGYLKLISILMSNFLKDSPPTYMLAFGDFVGWMTWGTFISNKVFVLPWTI